MEGKTVHRVIERLRGAALRRDGAGLADAELLEQYVRWRDEAAFEALVRRHGPMVLGVCRRVLRNQADAEDAFQATFLVLVRKAASLRSPGTVSNWLYGVAHNTALKAKAMNRKRHTKEREVGRLPRAEAAEEVWREVQALLDTELSRLPERYRIPIVLCDLEGKTIKEAGRHLGWPQGTVATRLARGRALLGQRLAKHDLVLSAGVLTAALSQGTATGTMAPSLVLSTLDAARHFAPGQAAAAGVIWVKAATLAEGVLKTMVLNKLKVAALVLLTAAVLGGGAGFLAYRGMAVDPPRSQQTGLGRGAQAQPTNAVANGDRPQEGPQRPQALDLGGQPSVVAWSADGRVIATRTTRREKVQGGNDDDFDYFSTIKIWDAQKRELTTSLGEVKNSGIIALALSPDGSTLAVSYRMTIAEGDRIELWDARKGALKKTIEMEYGRGPPNLAFSPDGKLLAVTFGLGTSKLPSGVRLFDVRTGKEKQALVGHKHLVLSVAFSRDGSLLATGGDYHDRAVRLWQMATRKELRMLEGTSGSALGLAFSPDGKTLACADSGAGVRRWDVRTGEALPELPGVSTRTLSLAFSADGKLLAALGEVEKDGKRKREAKLWDLQTGELLRTWEDVSCLAFGPGRTIALGHDDKTIKLWDLAPGRPAREESTPSRRRAKTATSRRDGV
jgi:RNA polymerase sigma factor (sigma-70 family)